jgi:DNA-binding response OmpR family regulator
MAGERILIVEDERAVARGLEYGLSVEGFEILWAKTGRQALDLARTQDPKLVLLDIRLPDISGFDVCRQLRSEGFRPPILMLTARDEEVDKVLGLELGADDYVVKPFSLRELTSRIRPLSRQALIEAVWGYDSEIGYDRTVDVHMRHLRLKLEPDPAHPRYLVTVRGVGYKFEP